MGEIDIHNLHPIYRYANEFSRLAVLPFHFKEDSGHFETKLGISETGQCTLNPKKNDREYAVFVPDIIDYKNKMIIEFEEETGNRRSGARYAKKGHHHEGDYNTKRDERRNHFYALAGFSVLRIWESQLKNDCLWRIAITEFIISCWRKKIHDSMTLSVSKTMKQNSEEIY